MFRKLISNLSYSPALIADISFYAKRLKTENATHRTAIIFTSLAMIIQSVAVFSPPESANASSEQDLIRGGVSSLEDFLLRYEHNEEDIKDIYGAAGITKSDIQSTVAENVTVTSDMYVMSRLGQLSAFQKEIGMSYQKSSGGDGIRYFSPLSSIAKSGARFQGWTGSSTSLGWFAIVKSSGGIVTKGIPTSINLANTDGSSTARKITVKNLTQNTNNDNFTSQPNDRVSYTVEQSNTSLASDVVPFSILLADVLEYAYLIDSGGGDFDTKTKILSWPNVSLEPGESQSRFFIVNIVPEIPATGVGLSNPASYDCYTTVAFGNIVKTPVNCPPVKNIESFFSLLPQVGASVNIGFSAVLLFVIVFFYLRTRQLKTEIRVIRHNFNSGTI